jgi:glycopeptide antibiotics resistance protein
MRYLFLLALAGVLYGSLYPFTFVMPNLSEIDFAEVFSANSRFDMFNNVVLFVPVGVLAQLAATERGRSVWGAVLLAILVAIAAQVLQVLVPARYPGLLDIIMNIVGLGVGLVAATVLSPLLARGGGDNVQVSRPAIFLALAFLCYQLYPFVPAMDWGMLKTSIKYSIRLSETPDAFAVLRNAAYWFVLFALVLPSIGKRQWRVLIFFLPFVVFALRLIIWRNIPSFWQFSGALLGVLAWAALSRARSLPIVAAAVLTALIVIGGLTPFFIRQDPADFSLVPFANFLTGSLRHNVLAFSQKIFLYGSLIWFLWQFLQSRALLAISVALFLLGIEVAQVTIASGTPEITDPLLALLVALALALLDKPRRLA